jgi:hypothetical protein
MVESDIVQCIPTPHIEWLVYKVYRRTAPTTAKTECRIINNSSRGTGCGCCHRVLTPTTRWTRASCGPSWINYANGGDRVCEKQHVVAGGKGIQRAPTIKHPDRLKSEKLTVTPR